MLRCALALCARFHGSILACLSLLAVAAGATLAVGDRASAESLVRIGCTGSYLTTPEMIRGRREFYEGGGPIVEPPSIRLLPVSSQ